MQLQPSRFAYKLPYIHSLQIDTIFIYFWQRTTGQLLLQSPSVMEFVRLLFPPQALYHMIPPSPIAAALYHLPTRVEGTSHLCQVCLKFTLIPGHLYQQREQSYKKCHSGSNQFLTQGTKITHLFQGWYLNYGLIIHLVILHTFVLCSQSMDNPGTFPTFRNSPVAL